MKDFLYDVFSPLGDVLAKVIGIIPKLLAAVAIVIIGYGVARGIEFLLSRVLKLINFDVISDKIGFSNLLAKGDIATAPGDFLSRALYWIIFIIFILAGIDALNLEMTSNLVALFFLYIPRLITALVIIIIGYYIANFLARTVLLASVNADLHYSKILSEIVRIFILILAFTMALEQLAIAGATLIVVLSIFLGGVALALSLAFGLGGRDVARDILESKFKEKKTAKGKKDDISHI
jgi:hypothetical protein